MTAPVMVIGREGQVARALAALSGPEVTFMPFGRADGVDITDPSSLVTTIDLQWPDIVVNAAAYTAVDKAETEPELAFAANRDGPAVLAEICATRGIPLIHLSTDYIFDGTKPTPYVEDDPIAPLGIYGLSKAEGEAAIRDAAGPHLILRTAWVYSPVGTNFVRTMLRLAETRAEVGVVNDQHGAPTEAGDIAKAIRALVLAIRGGSRNWGTFHMTGAGATNWHDFAAAIFAELAMAGRKVPKLKAIATRDYPTPARRPANSRLDTTKLRTTYGVVLPPWRESLARVVRTLTGSESVKA